MTDIEKERRICELLKPALEELVALGIVSGNRWNDLRLHFRVREKDINIANMVVTSLQSLELFDK